jgi:hypothetical protein
VRRNSAKVLLLVEMLAEGYPDLPCFAHAPPGAVCAGNTSTSNVDNFKCTFVAAATVSSATLLQRHAAAEISQYQRKYS